jgi:aquaporin TIP
VEGILTFFLVFVVHGTAVDPRAGGLAGFAIGATITLDILFGGALTWAAMNPARVFGPAVAANFWHDHYVYWVGPFVGERSAVLFIASSSSGNPAGRIETITVK